MVQSTRKWPWNPQQLGQCIREARELPEGEGTSRAQPQDQRAVLRCKEHPDVAITLNNLGSAYGNLGDYQKKNELLERSLKIMEQYYGAEHLEVAKTLNNLGSAYGELGDYQKEKELLERSLKIKEQHYGAEHPEVAKTLTQPRQCTRGARGPPEAERAIWSTA